MTAECSNSSYKTSGQSKTTPSNDTK